MKERIKKIRKELDLTQQAFADKIGMKQNTIAQYEMGRTKPSDAIVFSICREFNVNEEWLRTGEGEMFVQLPDNPSLDELARLHSATHADYQLIRNYLSLDPFVRIQIQSLFSTKE